MVNIWLISGRLARDYLGLIVYILVSSREFVRRYEKGQVYKTKCLWRSSLKSGIAIQKDLKGYHIKEHPCKWAYIYMNRDNT